MISRSSSIRYLWLAVVGFLLFAIGRALSFVGGSLPQPRAQLNESRVELGTVQVGQSVRYTVTLRNAGGARLLVLDLEPTCQCTVPELATRALAPGASVPLVVVFRPRSPGAKHQQVVVKTNDPINPALVLSLEAVAIAASKPPGGSAAMTPPAAPGHGP